MLWLVASGFAAAGLGPWLHKAAPRAAAWLLALVPLGITLRLAWMLPDVASGEIGIERSRWVEPLGVALGFRADGLSVLFALLIAGIGTLIVLYGGSYLKGHERLGRFQGAILGFMASMLGVALADDLLLLFVFWELTSFWSFLLIGFESDRKEARTAALMALLVTAAGGMALLVGLLLLGSAAGAWSLSAILESPEVLQGHPHLPWIVGLVLVGAFTKSAQVPFHFWLPRAMEAPTPVSAYLHSSTMVKAGVYLVARLSPVFAGVAAWTWTVTAVGLVTAVVGSAMALGQSDLKRVLAYSTVGALGVMTALLGIGTEEAAQAALAYFLAHALYKGSLFLVAGAIDHETGERDVRKLGGLLAAMPITAACGILAAASMAGLPPLFGFVAKETWLEAALHAPSAAAVLVAASFATGTMFVTAAWIAGVSPFAGRRTATPRTPHDPGLAMAVGAIVLAAGGLVAGLWPGLVDGPLLTAAVSSVSGEWTQVELELWHGVRPPLLLGAAALAVGTLLHFRPRPLAALAGRLSRAAHFGPEAAYTRAIELLNRTASAQTRVLQSGYLRRYVRIMLATAIVGVSWALLEVDWRGALSGVRPPRPHEAAVGILMLGAVLAAVLPASLVFSIVGVGVVGYLVALVFLLFGAPDLAITLVLVETLTVILLVLVLPKLPAIHGAVRRGRRLQDAAFALASGAMLTFALLAALKIPRSTAVRDAMLSLAVPEGHGRNVVNVVLVDFRSLDTLGEICVLGIAGVGVYALLRLRPKRGELP